MSKKGFVPFRREQFALLREAKKLVLTEFKQELSLQDKNILDKINSYSIESSGTRLKEIYQQLNTDTGSAQAASNTTRSSDKNQSSAAKQGKKIQIGDMVDGKQCVGFYRGQPVLEEVRSSVKSEASVTEQTGKVEIGDIVNGKQCVGFYRGQAVYK